ncbi:hypothetical protein FB567DRAFT_624403 [Paraphoma chrysanthemicola]|uniref:Uncharacterized protein n=1 Tax=Paraphoma chrysanthemicola TaxID=798071 RepID=A0A8K0W396_9PLEO|nr:hypothetical protein FB567DRAFT_624403 [Paraphoma chrysanthemicola]
MGRDHLQWRYQNSAWRRLVQQTNYHAPLPEASEAAEVAREATEAAREAATELSEFRPLELTVYARAHAAEVAHSQQQVDAFSKAQQDLKEKYREENKEALADLRREPRKKFSDHDEALRKHYREKREEALADLQSELQEKFADEEKQSLQDLDTLLRNEHTHASAEAQDHEQVMSKQKDELEMQFRNQRVSALNRQAARLFKDQDEPLRKQHQELQLLFHDDQDRAIEDQAEKFAEDEEESLNEPNLQDKYNEELHDKTRQKFRALLQLWSEKDKVIADLSKKLEEVTKSLEVAEEASAGEIAQTEEFLDLNRSRLDEGSQYVGITFPTAQTIDE